MSKAIEYAVLLEYPDRDRGASTFDVNVAAELRRLDAEVAEQCRINAMGAERELALMAKLEASQRENAQLRAELEAIYSTEPALFVSPGQLAEHEDPDEPSSKAGEYLPARKTSAGFFTLPLIPLPVRKS